MGWEKTPRGIRRLKVVSALDTWLNISVFLNE
jgi:hypothetical protein